MPPIPPTVKKSLEYMLSKGHARRLSPAENFFALCQRQQLYKNFSLVVKFKSKVNNKGLLYHALRSVILKNPILATTVVDTDYSDVSVPRPDHDHIKILDQLKFKDLFIDVPEKVSIANDGNKAHLSQVLNDVALPYGHGNGFWKLVVVDDYTLGYISNHIASDGISARYLFQDLQREFALIDTTILPENEEYDNKFLIDYEKDQDLLPELPQPLDLLVPHKPPLWFLPEFFWNTYMVKKHCYKTNPTAYQPLHYRSIKITPEELSRVKAMTRKQKVTMTPYIQTAWLFSQHQNGLLKDWNFTDMFIAVDTRHYIPHAISRDLYKYGLHACSFHTYWRTVKTYSWAKVRQFSAYAKWAVRSKRALYRVGIINSSKLAKKRNMDKFIREKILNSAKGNTMMSNVGYMSSAHGAFEFEDVVFSQHMRGTYFEYCLCGVSTDRGGLNFAINVPKNDVDEDTLDALIEDFRKNLINGCDE